ncbi:three-helix bundle dimerization domain-containing protein [Mycolicibacterium llatzerense]|uniref:three-helix bundle dimerization domain-containing protein n=1 Tax=Mycolicibacterium llatzerense TaxID=280871 RepID=UPI000B319DA2|nr:hypothetical protein [Mycolicibacterium llatzerense]MCT7370586.1 hypothetical protein [Mycolicibacterium llatzerense]
MTQVLHEPTRSTRSAADWVAEVAGKLARREGRNDAARDAEIRGWCREAATQFVDARIQAFVPLLVERIVGDRIRRDRDERGCARSVMACAHPDVPNL